MPDYFSCPHCGQDVPMGAPACPHCGSDETTGWSDEAAYGFLPESEPDPRPVRSIPWFRYAAALISAFLLTAFLANLFPWGIYLGFVLVPLAIGLTYALRPRGTAGGRSGALYQALLSRARGDEALVERLVEYERQRRPDGDPETWLRDAWERWERDSR